jgi:hypothetical protein
MTFLRRNLLAAILLGLASNAVAEPPADVPQLRQYTRSTPPFLRFRIIDGRLAVSCRSPTPFQIPAPFTVGRKEVLRIGNEQGHSTVQYERTTPNEQFLLNVGGSGGKVSICRTPQGKSKFTAVDFRQNADATTLSLGVGDHRKVLRAANLWQLAILWPKECQEDLFPLLDLLRPDWKMMPMVARVETSLLARARENATADRAHWAAMVAQLGDDEFTKREAADRALRSGGSSALSYLRELDVSQLDAEQQFRIRRILRKLSGRSEDDQAETVAAALARDPRTWLALLGRPEKATREIAARQLTTLLGKPIDVDPAAEPSTQEAKRERLRTLIEKK